MNNEYDERDKPIRGWEVVWRDQLGEEQTMLIKDRDRALIHATKLGGTMHPLIRGTL